MNRTEALGLIAKERLRQVERGWTAEHDDGHSDGSMLRLAVLYYQNAGFHKWQGDVIEVALREDGAPVGFTWDREWWKPKTPLRDLVRAGALCIAERERRQRKGATVLAPVDQKFELIVDALCTLEAPQ